MSDEKQVIKPEYLQVIFDQSADGLMLCDSDGTILLLNKAAEILNAANSSELLGKKVSSLVAEGKIDRSATQEVLDSKRQVSVIQKSPNSAHTLLVTGTPIFDRNRNISFVVVNERDISLIESMRQELEQFRHESERMRGELNELAALELKESEFVAQSDSMKHTLHLAIKLANIDASNILIQGESGTGKGLLAKYLHQTSSRGKNPLIQINCAALPENLLEAELFGYKKGAFTGASEKGKVGLFELASEGTLFLDEIGEMSLNVQAKLLKYLDDHEIMPLGGTVSRKIDCMIIAATNRDLEKLTRERRFRLDLLHRLKTFELKIPPLCERPEDILELVRVRLSQYNRKYNRRKYIGYEAFEMLKSYAFPGNVRELDNIVKQAVVMCDKRLLDEYIVNLLSGSKTRKPANETKKKATSLTARLDALEYEALNEAVECCRTTREIADHLGISQPTIVRKLKKHGINLKTRLA